MINIPIFLQVYVSGSCHEIMVLTPLLCFLLMILVVGMCYKNVTFYGLT